MYFAYAPFVRLLRMALREQSSFQHPVKATAGVISCIQLLLEQALTDILEKARYVMRQSTKKKTEASAPGRTTLFSRDIKTVLTVLLHRHPILSGRMRPLYNNPTPWPSSPESPCDGSRHGGRAKVSPKCAANGKATAQPARAKAAARAKSAR